MPPDRTGFDISVVITAHREGRLPHRTLRSVRRSIAGAAAHGVTSEIVVVLDRPDTSTRSFFEQQRDLRLYEVDFGDTGPSRNSGVKQARGRYINFLDADDLMSRLWISKALQAAELADHPAAWSPQFTVIFENESVVWRHIASSDPDFRPERLIDVCHWLPANLVRREIALQVPFKECSPTSGFGSEDWHWHCELLAAGVAIEVVDGTSLYYRRRHSSRSEFHIQHHAVYRPTQLFDFAGLERFGVEFPSREADSASLSTDVTAIESTVPSPRSGRNALYRRYLPPHLPEQFASALERLRFGTILHGASRATTALNHSGRSLCRASVRTARKLAHRIARPAKRVAKAILPEPVWITLKAEYHKIKRTGNTEKDLATQLPDWLLDDWKEIHAIEPLLFPSSEQLAPLV